MVLEVNNEEYNKKIQQSQTTKTGGSTGTASKSDADGKKSVDGGKSLFNQKTGEVVDKVFLNKLKEFLDEHKDLSPKDLNKAIIKQFGLDKLTDEQLKECITLANQLSDIDNTDKTDESKAANEAESTDSSENKSELQTLCEDYIKADSDKKFGKNSTIDDVIAAIKLKKANDEKLTEQEQAILDKFSENDKTQDKAQKNNAAIEDAKVYLSDDFKKLSEDEKMTKVAELYVKATNENYETMSKEEQQKLVAEQKDVFEDLAYKGKNIEGQPTDEQKKVAVKDMIFLTKMVREGKATVEELQDMPQAEFDAKKNQEENSLIKSVFNLVSKNELANVSYSKRADVYADKILELVDDKYSSLKTDKEKKAYREAYVDNILEKVLDKQGIKDATLEMKEARLKQLAILLEHVIEEAGPNDNIKEKLKNLETLSMSEKNSIILEHLKSQPQTPEIKKDIAEYEVKQMVSEHLNKSGIDNPTEKDVLDALKNIDVSKLSKSQRESLQKLEKEMTKRIDLRGNGKHKFVDKPSIEQQMRADGFEGSQEEYIKVCLKSIDASNIDEQTDSIVALLTSADNAESISTIMEVLKAKGISEAKINKICSDAEIWINAHSKVTTSDEQAKMIALGQEIGASEVTDINKKVVYNTPKWYKEIADVVKIGNTAVEYKDLQESFSQGLHEFRTRKDAAEIYSGIVQSSDHSDSTRASFTEVFIKNAKSDEDRLYHASKASEIDNAAVLEGVAAAKQYVTDKEIQKSYTNVVNNAAEKYSQEVQKTISKTLETGKISEETLAKTTSSNVEVSSSKASTASAKSQDNANTAKSENKAAQSQQTAGVSNATPNAKTSNSKTSNTPASTTGTSQKVSGSGVINQNVANVKSKASATQTTSTVQTSSTAQTSTAKTSSTASTSSVSSSNVVSNKETLAETNYMEAKKEALAEKIAAVTNDIRDAIIEWDISHNKPIEDTDIEAITEIATAIVEEEDAAENAQSQEDETTSTTTSTTKEKIEKAVAKTSNIGEVYDILVATLGTSRVHAKFIEAIASSPDKVISFISSKSNNPEVISEIFEHCTSANIKIQLLNLMPVRDVFSLIKAGKVTDSAFILKFINSHRSEFMKLSSADRSGLLSKLPKDEREAFLSDNPDFAMGLSENNSGNNAKNSNSLQLGAGETKVASNGEVYTTKGTTIGANNEGGVRKVPQGSNEWNSQYNRQASSELATTFGSTKVGIDGQTRLQKNALKSLLNELWDGYA